MPRCLNCGARARGPHGACPAPPLAGPEPEVEASAPVPGYRFVGPLGAGAFSRVIAAERLSDGAAVALKIARRRDPQAERELLGEARALKAIGAPAVPALLELTADAEGSPVLALERIEGQKLDALLESRAGPVATDEFAPLADAILAALEEVHQRGWAHLDLKAENVLVGGPPPVARVIDLALARTASDPPPSGAGRVAGTPETMAPEQFEGRPAGPRADVYAAGVLLFELLTGRPPFFGLSGEVQRAHLGLRPPRPSALAPVPPAVEAVVLRCLAKDPSQRHADAGALRAALRRAIADGVASKPPAPISAPPAPRAEAAEKRRAVLVFLQSGAGLTTLQQALASSGGVLGHAGRGRAVGVFDAESSADPVGRAVRSAQALIERGVAERARVDVAQVTVQRRGSGQSRFLSLAFSEEVRYPTKADPAGPVLTRAASEALPGRAMVPIKTGVDLWRLSSTHLTPTSATQPGEAEHRLVGRDGALSGLVESAHAAVAGKRPGVAVVAGEAGIGKSHLCAALAAGLRAAMPSAQVVELRLREPVAGLAEEAQRALLRVALDVPSNPGAHLVRERLEATLGKEEADRLWPSVALGLGVADPDDQRLRSLRAAPGALHALAVQALGEALRRRAAGHPLCVILDDAQFADDVALDALEYATLAEGGAPLWICACGRPGFERAGRRFGERAARRDALRLDPLDDAAAGALCRELLLPAENTPAEAVERLVRRAQGMPLLLVELVRGLKREGLVRRRSRGAGWYLATESLDELPELPLIDWLAEREVGALSPDLAAHARLTSLLGPEFTAEEAEGVLAELDRERAASEFPLDVRVGNRRLAAQGLLAAGEGGALRFRHALVRDAVARGVPAPLRRAIHRSATRYYRVGGGAPEAGRLALLAFHAARAEEGEAPGPLRLEAAQIYLELAERARVRHAYVEAEGTFTRALELLPEDDLPRRLAAHRGRGDTRFRIGRSEGSLEDFAKARELARRCGRAAAEIDTLLDEATAWDWLNDAPRSQALVEEARLLAARQGGATALLEARVQMGEGRALFRLGRWEPACAALERAVALATPLGDAGYETLIAALTMLEVVLPALGRTEEAAKVSDRAVALASERQDPLHLASALNNRRNLLIARRDLAAALLDQQRFMRIGRDLGIVLSEYYGEYNLGELLYQGGDLEAADAHVGRAVQIEADHPEVAPRPVAALLRARMLAFRGEEPEARALAAEIRARCARAEAQGGRLPPSEEVLLRAVELATRDTAPGEWEALLADSARDSIEQEPVEVRELRAVSLARRGRTAEARAAFEAALEEAQRLPTILEPRVRRGLAALGA